MESREVTPIPMTDATIAARILADVTLPSRSWRAPVLIALFGLPGTGKTWTARALASRYPLVTLSTDALRLRHGLPSGPATLAVMYEVTGALLTRKVGVLFDGIHLGRRDRDAVRQFARRHGAQAGLVYTTADRVTIEERLEARRRRPEQTTGEGKFVIAPEHFASIAAYLEPPTADEAVWRVDTSRGTAERQLAAVGAWLTPLLPAES